MHVIDADAAFGDIPIHLIALLLLRVVAGRNLPGEVTAVV